MYPTIFEQEVVAFNKSNINLNNFAHNFLFINIFLINREQIDLRACMDIFILFLHIFYLVRAIIFGFTAYYRPWDH